MELLVEQARDKKAEQDDHRHVDQHIPQGTEHHRTEIRIHGEDIAVILDPQEIQPIARRHDVQLAEAEEERLDYRERHERQHPDNQRRHEHVPHPALLDFKRPVAALGCLFGHRQIPSLSLAGSKCCGIGGAGRPASVPYRTA